MSAARCAYPNCCGRGSSVNKVILVCKLGRDPEIRSTQDGMRLANLAVATSKSWRDRVSGERKERTEWHRVVSFNERLAAEIAESYLKKGSKVYLSFGSHPSPAGASGNNAFSFTWAMTSI